jgi:hypothetical protein
MPKSLPYLIAEALQSEQIEVALDLTNKGLQKFPNFSYYQFLNKFLNIEFKNIKNIKNSILLPLKLNNNSLNKILSDVWKIEINSNHLKEKVDPTKILFRDSDFIIIKSPGLSFSTVDNRRLILLSSEFGGWVFHGPYRRVESGIYKIIIEFEIIDNLEGAKDLDFGCRFDVINDEQETIYAIDSQSIIKCSTQGSRQISHSATFIIQDTVKRLVIRALVEQSANVNLFLPRLSLVSN